MSVKDGTEINVFDNYNNNNENIKPVIMWWQSPLFIVSIVIMLLCVIIGSILLIVDFLNRSDSVTTEIVLKYRNSKHKNNNFIQGGDISITLVDGDVLKILNETDPTVWEISFDNKQTFTIIDNVSGGNSIKSYIIPTTIYSNDCYIKLTDSNVFKEPIYSDKFTITPIFDQISGIGFNHDSIAIDLTPYIITVESTEEELTSLLTDYTFEIKLSTSNIWIERDLDLIVKDIDNNLQFTWTPNESSINDFEWRISTTNMKLLGNPFELVTTSKFPFQIEKVSTQAKIFVSDGDNHITTSVLPNEFVHLIFKDVIPFIGTVNWQYSLDNGINFTTIIIATPPVVDGDTATYSWVTPNTWSDSFILKGNDILSTTLQLHPKIKWSYPLITDVISCFSNDAPSKHYQNTLMSGGTSEITTWRLVFSTSQNHATTEVFSLMPFISSDLSYFRWGISETEITMDNNYYITLEISNGEFTFSFPSPTSSLFELDSFHMNYSHLYALAPNSIENVKVWSVCCYNYIYFCAGESCQDEVMSKFSQCGLVTFDTIATLETNTNEVKLYIYYPKMIKTPLYDGYIHGNWTRIHNISNGSYMLARREYKSSSFNKLYTVENETNPHLDGTRNITWTNSDNLEYCMTTFNLPDGTFSTDQSMLTMGQNSCSFDTNRPGWVYHI